MLVVYALGRILILINLNIFLYQMKDEIIYFVSRGYKNISFDEKFPELTVLRQMHLITQCILADLSVKV